VLQKKESICNMTLLSRLAQAVALRRSSAKLISPFAAGLWIGFKAKHREGRTMRPRGPGVLSVQGRKNLHLLTRSSAMRRTVMMGASFRKSGRNLNWRDAISDHQPALLAGIEEKSRTPVERKTQPALDRGKQHQRLEA